MKRIVLLLIIAAGISSHTKAQDGSDYKSAIGMRLGTTYYDVVSFSFKTFISAPGAIELNVGFGSKGYAHGNAGTLSFAGTYQHHFDIKPVDGLKWFIGGGATMFNTFSDYDEYDGFGFGIYPTGGVDYKFSNIPLNLTADIRPTFLVANPNNGNDGFIGNLGIAARFTF